MDATDSTRGTELRPATGVHPIAIAVALALAGALTGCASHPGQQGATDVERARAAYARQNYGEAANLLADPAMKGDPAAQYALGYLYYYGLGVPQDLYRARSWLETSAKLGNREAKRALATLATYGKLPRIQEVAQAPAAAAPAQASAAAPVNPPAEAANPPGDGTDTSPVTTAAPQAAEPAAPPVAAVPAAPSAPVAPAPAELSANSRQPPAATPPAAPVAAAPTAPVLAPAAPAPVVMPAPAAPKADEAPASAPLPVKSAPHSDAVAHAGAAGLAAVTNASPGKGNAARSQCSPAETAAPAEGKGPATAKAAPPADPAPRDDAPDDVPSAPVVIISGDHPAGPVPVALHRPATEPVTLVPGSEQAAPIIRRRPAPPAAHPRYTIHLMSSPSREELVRTVRAFDLAGAAWYPVRQQGQLHYRLIFGGYRTLAEAHVAMNGLPGPLHANHPWINNYPTSVTVTAVNGIPTARVAAVGPEILR